MSSLYEVVFAGELLADADPFQVRVNLARLFQTDLQRIEALFDGRRTVIKGNLDAAAAEKYRLTLERAGARVVVCALGAATPEVAPAPAAAAAAPRGAGDFPPLQVAPRDSYMAAFSAVAAPDFGLAPVGADLQDQRPPVAAPALDLSQLSVAPAGSDLGQARAAPAGPPPDTAHLRLVD